MRVSIRSKLILAFTLVLLLSVGAISYAGLKFFLQDKEKYIYDLEAQQAQALADTLASKIRAYRGLLQIFGQTVTYRYADEATQRQALSELAGKFNDFYFVGRYRSGDAQFDPAIKNSAVLAKANLESNQLPGLFRVQAFLAAPQPGWAVRNVGALLKRPALLLIERSAGEAVAGVLPGSKLLESLPAEQRVYTAFVVDGNGDLLMHMDARTGMEGGNLASHPLLASYLGQRTVGSATMEFERQGQRILASLSPIEGSNLWLVIEIPAAAAFSAAQQLVQQSLHWVAVVFAVAVLLALIFAGRLAGPLGKLVEMTGKVSRGDFGVSIPIRRKDEIGQLVDSFNLMSRELKTREEKLEEKNKLLVQSEKMSAFGQMSAGIAHEVKNPLAGILGYCQLAMRKINPADAAVMKNLEIIERETKRCKEIVENLMKFARAEKTAMAEVDVAQMVKDSVALVDHQVTIAGMKIVRQYAPEGSLPKFWGNANQVQQVLTNLMLNAQQAMQSGGTITVATRVGADGWPEIEVADTGHGIKPEHVEKIFEPFFTTKPAGKGTGLGLSVSYGIIKDHKGEIKVKSTVGAGTTFTVRLPTKQHLVQSGQWKEG